MEILTVVEQTGPHQTKATPSKRYYTITFNDTRKTNYFPKDNEIPNLKGLTVDVDLQANGQYWNLKSLAIHGAAAAPASAPVYDAPAPDLSVKSTASSATLRLKCLEIAATVVSGEGAIITTAENFYQYITK